MKNSKKKINILNFKEIIQIKFIIIIEIYKILI